MQAMLDRASAVASDGTDAAVAAPSSSSAAAVAAAAAAAADGPSGGVAELVSVRRKHDKVSRTDVST